MAYRETATGVEEGNVFGSRSRSNSWRAAASTARRPCSILKEESEEELSTYYFTASRQSSRYALLAMLICVLSLMGDVLVCRFDLTPN